MTCSLLAVHTTTWGGSRKAARGAMRTAWVLPFSPDRWIKDGGGGRLFRARAGDAGILLHRTPSSRKASMSLSNPSTEVPSCSPSDLWLRTGCGLSRPGPGPGSSFSIFPGPRQVRGDRIGFPVEGDAHRFIGEVQPATRSWGHGRKAHVRLHLVR